MDEFNTIQYLCLMHIIFDMDAPLSNPIRGNAIWTAADLSRMVFTRTTSCRMLQWLAPKHPPMQKEKAITLGSTAGVKAEINIAMFSLKHPRNCFNLYAIIYGN